MRREVAGILPSFPIEFFQVCNEASERNEGRYEAET